MPLSDKLARALEHHRRGALDEAIRGYRGVLAREPLHSDALHLLGVACLQQGNAAEAIELISRAIALQPRAAPFHCNLGAAYRGTGDWERAAECCRQALRLEPRYPEAWNNLGLALQDARRWEEAAGAFGEAVRLRPDDALLHNNLGNALRERGDREAALASFRRAVQLNPQSAEARSNLGQFLLETHRVAEALPHCETAVRLRPELPHTHNNLGNVLRELGRLEEAQACYHEALRLDATLAMTRNNIGQALQEEGRLDEALTWYEQALAVEPRSARFLTNQASALAEQERYAEAAARYGLALTVDAGHVEAISGLAAVRHEEGRYDEARGLYREALQRKPDLAAAHSGLGSVLEELGALQEAEACYRAALQHEPRQVGALARLATLLRGKLPAADFDALERAAGDRSFHDDKRSALLFALASACDARGASDDAARHAQEANALRLAMWRRQGKGYDPAEHRRFVARLIAQFRPELFERLTSAGSVSERPIFIVGLPRSGTTLVEQILASHSQVHGAGELRLARELFETLPGVLNIDAEPVECIGRLNAGVVGRLADEHLARLARLDQRAPRIADKMPDNHLYLGYLALLFPRARFIHCRRDLRDIAVSCWLTNFRQIRWACAPEHIAARFADYQHLTAHWRSVLPVPVLEVAYEDAVADVEAVARRLVEWCGLDWEPACLAFHKTSRPIRTASLTQVRQPIYKHSVERWRLYAEALAPLFNILPRSEKNAEKLGKL